MFQGVIWGIVHSSLNFHAVAYLGRVWLAREMVWPLEAYTQETAPGT